MKIIKQLKLIFPFLLVALFFSCDEDSSPNKINAQEPTISVRLVDAPGDYEAVNVEIVDVLIKMNDDNADENGWISLESESDIVNLLDFTGGISKVLVDRFSIPAGTLSQMRLVLGDGNTIVIKDENDEDEAFDLKTPSAQQSGLKLKVNTLIEEGFSYDFILDFNVEKSIVHAGNSGNIILKPVLYVSAEVNSGIIEGTVSPNDIPVVASVLIDDNGTPETDDDFVISSYTDSTGAFALWGVPEGIYDVIVIPVDEESDYSNGIEVNVTVINGEVTTITEAIELMLKPGVITGTISGLAAGIKATISVNDTASTSVETDTNGMYVIQEVAPDDYTVTISAEGYVSQEFMITLEPAEEEVVDAALVLK